MNIDKKDKQFLRQHKFNLKRIFGKMVVDMQAEVFNPATPDEEKIKKARQVENLVSFLQLVGIYGEEDLDKPDTFV